MQLSETEETTGKQMSLEYEENHLSEEIMIQFYQETILADGSCVILVLLGE